MNPIEIAYFKHFMLDKSEHMKFITRYKKRHFADTPESFEAYLNNTNVKDVLLKAFSFQISNQGVRYSYTFDYWKEVDDAWQKYWPLMENNHSNERWWDLKGTFAILRQNWDKSDFFLKENAESIEDTFKRLGVDRPLPKPLKIEPKFREGDTLKGRISGDVVVIDKVLDTKYVDTDGRFIDFEKQNNWELIEPDDIQLEADNKEPLIHFSEEDDPLAGFDFFEVERTKSYRLKSNEISINVKNSNKLTFNIFESKEIIKQGFKYAKLGKNKSGDICLVLNNIDGVIITKNGKGNRVDQNVIINSSDFCKKLTVLFNIKDFYDKLIISRLPSENKYLIYKITKQL